MIPEGELRLISSWTMPTTHGRSYYTVLLHFMIVVYCLTCYTNNLSFTTDTEMQDAEPIQISQFNAVDPTLVIESINQTVSQTIWPAERKSSFHKRKNMRKFLKSDAIFEEQDWSAIETTCTASAQGLSQSSSCTSLDGCNWKELVKNLTAMLQDILPLTLKKDAEPFAYGAQYITYHAQEMKTGSKKVLKQMKFEPDEGEDEETQFHSVVQTYCISIQFAQAFNQAKPAHLKPIEFVRFGIITLAEKSGKTAPYIIEDYIDGKYETFNSNTGKAYSHSQDHRELQAFSHFTWVHSNKQLVVCNLQGTIQKDKILLTDPAIHADQYMLFGSTNLGIQGIKLFMRRHICNEICKQMKLEPFSK